MDDLKNTRGMDGMGYGDGNHWMDGASEKKQKPSSFINDHS
jgi:hypothetical protein